MALDNQWVGYVTRSYSQIKNSLLQRLGQLVPEVTDHSESNILVIIISMFAGTAEMLNYYIDNMAREAFITTARRFSSVVKHTRLIDYRIKAAIPASVDIQIRFLDNEEEPLPVDVAFIIPAGTIFSTDNNIKFILLEDYNVEVGDTIINLVCQQKELTENVDLGQTTGVENEVFSLGDQYVHNSIYLTINGTPWERQETLGRSEPSDTHYIIEVTTDRLAYVRFGDDFNGAIPEPGLIVLASYYNTLGTGGNVDANTIKTSTFDFGATGATIDNPQITNPLPATGGTGYESRDRIVRSAPLSLRTLDRAVTRQDYIDITKLAPGVDKATLHYECGKYIDIYISPNGGGIAQTALLLSTFNWVSERKMVTTFIRIVPAGESYIHIEIDATAKFRRDPIVTKQDIINALIARYNYAASDVNRKVRTSDVIALVDNLDKVDFLDLVKIYLIPYMRPLNSNIALLKEVEIRSGSVSIVSWRLQFDGTYMRLFRENEFLTNLTIDTPYIDSSNIMSITILPNAYELGNEWSFTTYPINQNIEVDDFTVPILRLEDIFINVNEQLSNN